MSFSRIYTRLCKFAGKSERLRNVQDPPGDLRKNLELLDLDVTAREVVALAVMGVLIGGGVAAVSLVLTFLLELSPLIPLVLISVPLVLYFSIGWYPSWRAGSERNRELGGISRLICYITVSLKINPNLEAATIFSAREMRGSLGNFREELWKTCLSVHHGVREAISRFAQRWGEESREIKRSIDLIKSSATEKNERARNQMLDQALETSFEGIRDRMDSFAAGLQLPTTIIYGIGVLLPLVLLAVLPVLSSTGVSIGAVELTLIYCFLLPLGVYILEKEVLSKRPFSFSSLDIPLEEDRGRAIVIPPLVAAVPILTASIFGLPPELVALISVWSLSAAISAFCYLSSYKTFRTRRTNRDLEEELCDALAQLGGQLKGNRPPEDAFERTAGTTEGSRISEILERTSTNIKCGGMGLHSALFDPERGSLREVHSPSVRHAFKMLTALMNRSAEAAGDAILNLADHLKKLKEVEDHIRRTLQDVVSSMKSVALFFAPFVAAISVQLQQVLSERTSSVPLFGSNVQISSPAFLGVLGFYVIIITMLLSTYIVEIERGDDALMKRMTIARSLPVATAVFTLGLFLGGQMLSILLG